MIVYKRLLAAFTSIVLLLSQPTLLTTNAITAEEICENANKMYSVTWTPLKTVKSFVNSDSGKYTYFEPGKYYHIPYGQPYSHGYYIGYDIVNENNPEYNPVYVTCITASTFLEATKDINSPFYTQRGYGDTDDNYFMECPYYALDCSSFVSLSWNLQKRYVVREFASGGQGSRAAGRPPCVYDIGLLSDIASDLGYNRDNGIYPRTIYPDNIISYANDYTGRDDSNLMGYALGKPGCHIVLLANKSAGNLYYDVKMVKHVAINFLNNITINLTYYLPYRLICINDNQSSY